VEHIQTHLSHVFLTRERVYKLHKAAHFGFVDFSTRADRNADALREVRLNRRLAPDVYLGVAPVRVDADPIRVGELAEEILSGDEHCVVMRRLPEGRDALSTLERGELGAAELDSIADLIAHFHLTQRLGTPAPFSADEWRRRVLDPVLDCFTELEDSELSRDAARGAARSRERFEALSLRFERRRSQGRAVDGHGDLHLQHLWLEADRSGPIAIDCIAFREDLRRIDAACDVAFLAMDLRYRARNDLGEHFLARYASAADDHDLYAVVDFFIGYRAAVRAKVAALAARDPEVESEQRARAAASARAHLTLALDALAAPGAGGVIVMAGVVGSGKSSVAAVLAETLGGVVITSDRVRKAMVGLRPSDRAGAAWGADLYTPERTCAVYESLLDRARTVAASGRTAILDATYARRDQRDALRAGLETAGHRVQLVEARCARGPTLERLATRQARGADPSDAGPELYDQSLRGFEAPDEWPAARRHDVATDAADWRDRVRELAPQLTAVRLEPLS
jgi:aminoglycoside phosphotransferase family enzyme/predicted kinase